MDPSWPPPLDATNQYPLWSRALVGEMLPDVVPPLTWTMVWEPCAAMGWRDAMIRRMGFDEEEFSTSHPETIGLVDGYAYLNASHLRIWADRSPDLTIEHIDRLLVADGYPPPGHQRQDWHGPDPVTEAMLGQWYRWVMESRNQLELDGCEAQSRRCRDERVEVDQLSDLQLVQRAQAMQPLCRRLFEQHANQTLAATIGPWVVTEACATLGQPANALRLLSGLGQVETVGPSLALWDLSRLVRESKGLSGFFDRGVDGLDRLIRLSTHSDSLAFAAGLDAVLDEVGYRGINEWDLASPTWDIAPDIVLALIDRLRHCPDGAGPRERRAGLEADRERLAVEIAGALTGSDRDRFVAGLGASAAFLRGRELSRTSAVRVIHEMRLVLRALAKRGLRRGDFEAVDDIWMLTADELEYYADGGLADVAVRSAQRRRLFAELQTREPAVSLIGSDDGWIRAPAPSSDDGLDGPLESGDAILGLPGSPGLARGPARVIGHDADLASIQPGDVVVMPHPMLAATPLFVSAGAIVTDTGGTFTHAVVVARELGIPMVVGASAATDRIVDGTMVNVDGLTGVVSVADPGPST